MKDSLNSCSVLVTRPRPQGEVLCELIRDAGGEAVYFPTIDIVPINRTINGLPKYDWIIFVSPQAVCHRMPEANTAAQRIAAVGLGTVQALKDKQIHNVLYPKEEWSTEGLLKLPE